VRGRIVRVPIDSGRQNVVEISGDNIFIGNFGKNPMVNISIFMASPQISSKTVFKGTLTRMEGTREKV
jgi:hypothetical protein